MFIRGKNQEPTQRIGLGDIGVIPKLEASTGDTLTVREDPVTLDRIVFPDTAYSASIHPKTRNDVDKLSTALGRIMEEDPTLRVHRDDSTGETIMSGLGESHIQIAAERLARKYGVNVEIGLPKVAYMETVTVAREGRGPPRPPVRRPRPVRRLQPGDRADRARRRLRVRGQDRWRRGPSPVHPGH